MIAQPGRPKHRDHPFTPTAPSRFPSRPPRVPPPASRKAEFPPSRYIPGARRNTVTSISKKFSPKSGQPDSTPRREVPVKMDGGQDVQGSLDGVIVSPLPATPTVSGAVWREMGAEYPRNLTAVSSSAPDPFTVGETPSGGVPCRCQIGAIYGAKPAPLRWTTR
jgi:hypothetical protein